MSGVQVPPRPPENPQVKRQNADKARLTVAAAAAFLPLTGEQVATLLAFVAIATGERVVRRASAD